jgi:hypothetical protein
MFRPELASALVISLQNATASMLVSRQKEASLRKSGHSKPKISQYGAGTTRSIGARKRRRLAENSPASDTQPAIRGRLLQLPSPGDPARPTQRE